MTNDEVALVGFQRLRKVSSQQHHRGLCDPANPVFDPHRENRHIVRRRVHHLLPVQLVLRFDDPHFKFNVAFKSRLRIQGCTLARNFLLNTLDVLACPFDGRFTGDVKRNCAVSASYENDFGIMAG